MTLADAMLHNERVAKSKNLAGDRSNLTAASEPVPVACNLTIKPSTDEQKLNKTERGYLAYLRRLNPEPIGIQNITLKLGDDCRYTPDFNYINENGRLVFAETKGFFRDDAKVKLKVAARLYRWADFHLVVKYGVGWKIETVNP